MRNKKLFFTNFGLSLLGYVGVIVLALLWHTVMSLFDLPIGEPVPIPIVVRIVLWLHVSITATLLFLLGTRLNLLGSHWVNFFSVFGITIIALSVALTLPYTGVLLTLPYIRLATLTGRYITRNHLIFVSIFALLPSVIIWIGMLYQAKRI